MGYFCSFILLWWRVSPLHFANTYTLTTILAIEEAYQLSWFTRAPLAVWNTGKAKESDRAPRKSIYTFERPHIMSSVFPMKEIQPVNELGVFLYLFSTTIFSTITDKWGYGIRKLNGADQIFALEFV
jgi:hypothetical protein